MSRIWTIALAILIVPLAAFAQPLTDRVPNDAMVYVGWRGAADLGPGYAQSNLKAVMDDSNIPQFIDQFLPAVMDRISQLNPQAGQMGQMFSTIAKASWQHPTAFFFSGLEMPRGGPPIPRLGIIWQPGADSDALADHLNQLSANAPPPFHVKVVRHDGLVALVAGYENPESALAGGGNASLADNAEFKSAMQEVQVNEPVFGLYVDYGRLLGVIERVAKSSGDVHAPAQWEKIKADLGLGDLKRIVAASGFEGRNYAARAFVEAPQPRTGLINLSSGQPLDDQILLAIPENVTSAGAGRFDFTRLFDVIHQTVADLDPDSGRQMDRFLESVNSESGVELRKDLLESLGDEWAYFTDPDFGGRGLASLTLVNHLKDPEKFEQSLAKIEDYAIQQIQKQLGPDVPVRIAFDTAKIDGMTIHYLAVPLVSPSWVVHDGNLYIAPYPQVAASAARHASQKGATISKNPRFMAVLRQLGHENPSSFSFKDLQRTAPDAYGGWLAISRLAGFGDLFGIKSPPLLMPELPKLLAHLSPAGSVGWADEKGFHMKAIEPFPGSALIASDPAVSLLYAAPLEISVLLPALNRAREQANRVKSASNLRQIGLASLMYANTHNNKLPPDLATIMKEEDVVPQIFVNPRSDHGLALPADHDQWPAWVEQNSDYVWIGRGKTAAAPPDTVIAYEKIEDNTEGVNLLFVDGHVEFMNMAEARQAIRHSKQEQKPDGRL